MCRTGSCVARRWLGRGKLDQRSLRGRYAVITSGAARLLFPGMSHRSRHDQHIARRVLDDVLCQVAWNAVGDRRSFAVMADDDAVGRQ